MYGCESWTVKKAECWRIDAFELWCWRRLLRVPWTARRSNQSILKRSVLGVHWKDWCWSWNSNTLATSCEELTYWKRHWCWERLRAGGEGDDRGWDGWMASLTQWTWIWVNSGSWWWTGRPGVCSSWGRKESDITEQVNWTEPTPVSDPENSIDRGAWWALVHGVAKSWTRQRHFQFHIITLCNHSWTFVNFLCR